MLEESAKEILRIEAQAIQGLIGRIDHRFVQAVEILEACKGRVVVTGMGKSGLIGRKIAATLASTGTPALFLHPAEGIHGDLGMVSRADVVIALSNSGETEELLKILPSFKRISIPLISLTGKIHSSLAKESKVALDVSVEKEAGPIGLVPTSSTTAMLAMGDALAIVLMEKRGLNQEDFAFFHPGGNLGRRLLLKVRDVWHEGGAIPNVDELTPIKKVINEITAKKFGVTIVSDSHGIIKGVVTDGDLRRLLYQGKDPMDLKAGDVMTSNPKVIEPEALAAKAVKMMEDFSITSLPVVDDRQKVVGIIHLHDLLKAGVI